VFGLDEGERLEYKDLFIPVSTRAKRLGCFSKASHLRIVKRKGLMTFGGRSMPKHI
jgi:hypothetical protein